MKIRNVLALSIAVLGLLVSFFVWSLASPPGSAPDDDFHLPSIWCSHGKVDGICDPEFEGDGYGKTPTPLSPSAICFAFKSEISAACQASMFDWKNKELQGSRTNENGRFPNGFYWTLNFLIGDNTLTSALSMRIFNGLLAIITLIATYLISTSRIKIALLSSWIAVLVPLSVFTITSTNPSSWTIIGLGTYWAALLTYLNENESKIKLILSALLTVFSSLIAIQSRSEASPYIIFSTIIIFILDQNYKKILTFNKKLILPMLLILYSFFEFITTPSTLGWSTGLPGGDPNRNMQELWFRNISDWPTFITGSLGGWPLGWLDVPMPSIVYFFTMLTFVGILFTGAINSNKAKTLSLILIFGLLVFLPLRILALGKNFVGENVQPRYFLPLLFILVGIAMYSPKSIEKIKFSFTQLIVIFVSISIAHSFALHFTLRRFITGSDVINWDLNQNIEWWWDFMPSPMSSWFGASLGFSGAAAIALWQINKNSKELN